MNDAGIKTSVYEVNRKLAAEHKRHTRRIEKLRQELCDTRKQCPHNKTSFQPDPSGNNDSTTTCEICGKVLAGR